jgi:hypothetical protein
MASALVAAMAVAIAPAGFAVGAVPARLLAVPPSASAMR